MCKCREGECVCKCREDSVYVSVGREGSKQFVCLCLIE